MKLLFLYHLVFLFDCVFIIGNNIFIYIYIYIKLVANLCDTQKTFRLFINMYMSKYFSNFYYLKNELAPK